MNTIINFYQHKNGIATGGQPTPSQLEVLKDSGVEVVLNISPSSTPNYLSNEAELTEHLGLEYIHYPVDCSNLTDQHYATFKSIVNSVKGKSLFIHCGGNIKSSNLVHLYQVMELGVQALESMKELQDIQTPEQKWLDYFKQQGLN